MLIRGLSNGWVGLKPSLGDWHMLRQSCKFGLKQLLRDFSDISKKMICSSQNMPAFKIANDNCQF
jgi:hypothetical protein